MKKISFIRTLSLLAVFLCGFLAPAQQSTENKGAFVRIYDLEGKKILKGRVAQVSDTSIQVSKRDKLMEVAVKDIGFIRTRHSVGNNVLIGAIAGSAFAATTFAAAADPDAWIFGYTVGEGVLTGLIVGAPLGGGIGALTALFKRSDQYDLNGEQEKWLEIKDVFKN